MIPVHRHARGWAAAVLLLFAGCSQEDTPQYTIDRLIEAVRRRDDLAFHAYADTRSLDRQDQNLLKQWLRHVEEVESVRTVEDRAEARLIIRDQGLNAALPLIVSLEREDRWRVAEVAHNAWESERMAACQAQLPEINRAIRAEIKEAVEFGEVVRIDEAPAGLRVLVPFTNQSDRGIRAVFFTGEYEARGGRAQGGTSRLYGPAPGRAAEEPTVIQPGETYYSVLEIPRALEEEMSRELAGADLKDADFTFTPHNLFYEDGEELKVYSTCSHYLSMG